MLVSVDDYAWLMFVYCADTATVYYCFYESSGRFCVKYIVQRNSILFYHHFKKVTYLGLTQLVDVRSVDGLSLNNLSHLMNHDFHSQYFAHSSYR